MTPASDAKKRLRIINPVYPAFNIYSYIAKKTTALGPVCIATSAREVPGWEVEIIDENNMRRHGPKNETGDADHEYIQGLRPANIVGLYGGLTSTIPRLYEIAKFYKGKGVITIAGGQHFTEDNIAEALHSFIDYVVIGEGEETIKELLSAFDGKRGVSDVRGIAYIDRGQIIFTPKRDLLTDFEKLPLPDFSLVRYAHIELYPVGRVRGCGMDCEFCTVKGKPRFSSNQRMLENIRLLTETYDARKFFIVDDLFGQQRKETISLCYMLRDYQIKIGKKLDFTVQIRLDKAKDTELLTAMRQAGVSMVAIGFESPVEEELKAMNKCISSSEMISLAKVYRKFGFLVHGMFIFGYPQKNESQFIMPVKERIKRFKGFIKKARIDTVQVLLPVPLPGTELRLRLQQQNRIYPLKDIGWEYYDGNFPLFEPDPPMTPQELQNSAQLIMGKCYRFNYMFRVGLHIFFFPAIIFFMHNFKSGWQKWYRTWRNNLIRFTGWIIIKKWSAALHKGEFLGKLKTARSSNKIEILQSR